MPPYLTSPDSSHPAIAGKAVFGWEGVARRPAPGARSPYTRLRSDQRRLGGNHGRGRRLDFDDRPRLCPFGVCRRRLWPILCLVELVKETKELWDETANVREIALFVKDALEALDGKILGIFGGASEIFKLKSESGDSWEADCKAKDCTPGQGNALPLKPGTFGQ